jgi:hypothetical protein
MKQLFVVAGIGLAAFIAGCSGDGSSTEPADSGAAVQPAGSSDAPASVTPVSGTAQVVFHVPGMV